MRTVRVEYTVKVTREGIVNLTIDGQIGPAKPSCLCAHRFLPDLKGLGAQQSIMDRLHEVAAKTKEILCDLPPLQTDLPPVIRPPVV